MSTYAAVKTALTEKKLDESFSQMLLREIDDTSAFSAFFPILKSSTERTRKGKSPFFPLREGRKSAATTPTTTTAGLLPPRLTLTPLPPLQKTMTALSE